MIATILPGSANFHAVGYNEHKVSTGSARRIEMKNFGALGMLEPPTPGELTSFLQGYSDRNKRITKAQFHVAFSCKGHEMSEAEILEFAHEWLKEMGYINPGQPILAYAHNDTDNTHIHIITSRVAPDGRKIEHDHERRRSQEIVDRLMKMNREDKIEKDIEIAKNYSFTSMAQFKALLTSMGYEVYVKDENVYLKFGGRIRKKLDKQEVESFFKSPQISKNEKKKLRMILCKYRDLATDKESLAKEIKKKFGIDIVFFGRKDKPFGYILIDHNRKSVIHGGHILALDRLLDFATPEQRLDRIESHIEHLLKESPTLSHSEIHEALSRFHAWIKKGILYYNGTSRPIKPELTETITRNNRIQWIESFNPQSESERDILCELGKTVIEEEIRDKIKLGKPSPAKYSEALTTLKDIAEDRTIASIKYALYKKGFVIRQSGDETFAIDFSNRLIINLSSIGYDIEAIRRQHMEIRQQLMEKSQSPTHHAAIENPPKKRIPKSPRDAGGGSSYQNREWEVGSNHNYDDMDSQYSMKR